jgi:hypothetical protein
MEIISRVMTTPSEVSALAVAYGVGATVRYAVLMSESLDTNMREDPSRNLYDGMEDHLRNNLVRKKRTE